MSESHVADTPEEEARARLMPIMPPRAPTWTAAHPPGVWHYGTTGFAYGGRWATVVGDHTDRALLLCHGDKGEGFRQFNVPAADAKAAGERWVIFGSTP